MMDVSLKDTADQRRAVRLTFALNGIVGREDIIVSAGSDAGAVALAGIAFGQAFFFEELLERSEYLESGEEPPPMGTFYLKTVEIGTATIVPLGERLRGVMGKHGDFVDDDHESEVRP